MRSPTVLCAMVCVHFLAAWTCVASPPRPNAAVTVTGTVVEAKWFPKEVVKGTPGRSEGGDRDRTIPAHFNVRLKDADVEIVRSTGNKSWDGPSGKQPVYLLRVNSDDKELLKPGMTIKVANYRSAGGPSAIWSTHDKVEILSPPDPAGK